MVRTVHLGRKTARSKSARGEGEREKAALTFFAAGRPVGSVFQRLQGADKGAQVLPGDSAKRLSLDTRQFAVNSLRGLFPISRKPNDEGAAIVGVRFASDPSATDQAIEDARKSRAAVRQSAMELRDGGVTGSGEVRKDVPLALGDAETIEKYTNAVGGAMNLRNKAQRH
jgi:hypothetical protein